MIFTSLTFALFFFIVAAFNYLLPVKYRWTWLLAASIFFYMFSGPAFILVALLIILLTYYGGIEIEKYGGKKVANQLYIVTIVANAALLIFFKYTNFFTSVAFDSINFMRQKLFSISNPWHNSLIVNIAAPLGISYITFQAMGYLIEIKRGNHSAEKKFGYLATFLLFFPKIIAGPVERAHRFLPQITEVKKFHYNNISTGLKLIVFGLFKKLVVADRLSIYVSAVLDNADHHNGITLIIGVVFYVFQIYADFSGYTDMALGLGKILGYDLIQNFNRPLFAKSVTEFWRKWHISLSTWFADYFYNPIAIAKRDWGNWSVVYAFFLTFIVLGFWHGANWTFIVFGALQGLVLTAEFFTRKQRKNIRKKIPVFLNNLAGILFTIGYFAFSLIFFRASSVKEALTIVKRIFTATGGSIYIENPSIILFSIAAIGFFWMVEFKNEYFNELFTLSNNKHWLVRNCYYCMLLVVILIAGVFDGGEFIYFQF
ncbi:MBOAT family protein [Ferruginibacter sp.]|uniref:MBOAT family O-acyltransferase n=1 Tax=Ferruginibacter sp. TaxID=1940288 RepID=UPI0026591E2D|nr:MBOAT family O-acyltransferase [Ferruginibacter sp.]